MSENLKTLIGKLNGHTREALTRAATICMDLRHYEVEIEHLVLALIERGDGDFNALAAACDIEPARIEQDLRRALNTVGTGNTRTPVFSSPLAHLLEHAWMIASLENGGRASIRGAHLLLALLTDSRLNQMAVASSRQFGRFAVERIRHEMHALTRDSVESVKIPPAPPADMPAPSHDSAGGLLEEYTVDLTQLARDGAIDPVIGRDAEIRQTIDILLRRRQNNPILTGEAGVGKTAVVEGLALRIARDEVPDCLRGVEIRSLDLGLLQAGASVKGEFERRLKGVIDQVDKAAGRIVLFIDEAHTIIGAGGQAGQQDAANLLKPALARGQLRTIAATTWSEYKKYFEKDAALARRFQIVKIEEPTEEVACSMLRAMAPLMERHFGVRILDAAVTEAVRLSHRYISGRQLPDKAVSLLDTACSRVALGQGATPAPLEEAIHRAQTLACEIGALEREQECSSVHAERLAVLRTQSDQCEKDQLSHRARWEQEKQLAGEIAEYRNRIARRHGAGDDAEKLSGLMAQLRALQGEVPLVPLEVDGQAVAQVVAGWTGIPLGAMMQDEIRTVLELNGLLERRVLGQPHAMASVAKSVQTSRAELDDPGKPRAVFLFVGPSGTGKTETALALADLLYGGRRKLITINLSEFQEAHSVSGLKGSPPGYVGYGEGGVLTEAVRRNPYSVVLLDEIEKAHVDVLELFYQVFDKGALDDAEGRQVDFRNTIIIATSNIASAVTMQACLAGEAPAPDALAEMIRPHLVRHFKPALLARMQVVPFYPIGDDALARIIEVKLGRIAGRLKEHHGARFSYDAAMVDAIHGLCTDADSGARNIDHVINGRLLPDVAQAVLARMADGLPVSSVDVRVGEDGGFDYLVA